MGHAILSVEAASSRVVTASTSPGNSPGSAPRPSPPAPTLGESPPTSVGPGVRCLATVIPKLAASEVGVLIEGETGVGKSFVARLIHEAGPRSGEPFRSINCAAIPETLFETELFGHERGAFTGAVSARSGAFEAVGKGTLFLDEIGDVP